MKKTLLTKREIIFVCLMIAVLLGLFISSSMTYHEQEMSPGFIHRHFPIIERRKLEEFGFATSVNFFRDFINY